MDFVQLTEKAELTVTGLYKSLTRPILLYHNIDHVRDVVSACRIICDATGTSLEDRTAVTVAAWWHDVGYLFGGPKDHESRSTEKAAEFLQSVGMHEAFILNVRGCIMATKMPQDPKNDLERIICDADLYHLGTANFRTYTKLIRKEAELYGERPISASEWRASTISLLRNHHYHTEYARMALDAGQAENLGGLLEKKEQQEKKEIQKEEKKKQKEEKKLQKQAANVLKLEVDGASGDQTETISEGKKEKKKDKGKDKDKDKEKAEKQDKPSRGIETMFRLTSTNHIRMSEMADSKAHIMISVNSIIISVVLSMLVRKIEDYPHLIIPTIILLGVNVVAIIFSVLATRPNISKGTFTKEDVLHKKVNLLFFGNFHGMGLGDYESGVKSMMVDNDYLYSSMIRDIYFLGVVLGKKYKLLRISYTIFMYGIIAAVLAFAISVYFSKG